MYLVKSSLIEEAVATTMILLRKLIQSSNGTGGCNSRQWSKHGKIRRQERVWVWEERDALVFAIDLS
jgi:hypothetical protein